jgi:ribonuclease-3
LLDRLDDRLARQAFAHASLVPDRARSYERLEFLGDSVLSLCITGELYRRFPTATEGHLARLRAYIVSRETCAKVAAELDLGQRLRHYAPREHDRAEVESLSANANVLADLTEAVIGAVYLTFGFECVRGAVVEAFEEHILYAERSHVDSKTELQEVLAKTARTVVYRLVNQSGPAHDRRFAVEAVVDDEVLGRGEGASKKRAEQMAAGQALAALAQRGKEERPRRVRLLARRPRAATAPAGVDTPAGGDTPSGEPPAAAPAAGEEPVPATGLSPDEDGSSSVPGQAGSRSSRRRRRRPGPSGT